MVLFAEHATRIHVNPKLSCPDVWDRAFSCIYFSYTLEGVVFGDLIIFATKSPETWALEAIIYYGKNKTPWSEAIALFSVVSNVVVISLVSPVHRL